MSTYSTTKYVCDLCGTESDSYPTGAPRGWLTISHDPASSNGHLCDECREDVVKALTSARGVEATVSGSEREEGWQIGSLVEKSVNGIRHTTDLTIRVEGLVISPVGSFFDVRRHTP